MAEEKEQRLLQPSKTSEEELFAAAAAVEVDIGFASLDGSFLVSEKRLQICLF